MAFNNFQINYFRRKSIQFPKLDVPAFTITPSTGEILPGNTARIEIHCHPEEVKVYNEMIFLHVTEPLKEHLHGKNITLHVTGSEPLLNFEIPRDIFREQFVIQNLEQFTPPTCVSRFQFVVLHNKLFFEVEWPLCLCYCR